MNELSPRHHLMSRFIPLLGSLDSTYPRRKLRPLHSTLGRVVLSKGVRQYICYYSRLPPFDLPILTRTLAVAFEVRTNDDIIYLYTTVVQASPRVSSRATPRDAITMYFPGRGLDASRIFSRKDGSLLIDRVHDVVQQPAIDTGDIA